MGKASEGAELLRAHLAAARRHVHLLIPAEERACPLEIVDLVDALLELRERGRHGRVPYRPSVPLCQVPAWAMSSGFRTCNGGDARHLLS